MSLIDLLKGPVTCNVTMGYSGNITKLNTCPKRRPITHVDLRYTGVQIGKNYWFPWVKNTKAVIWQIDTLVHCEEGRELKFSLVVAGKLEEVLEYAFISCLETAIQQISNERTFVLRGHAHRGTRH